MMVDSCKECNSGDLKITVNIKSCDFIKPNMFSPELKAFLNLLLSLNIIFVMNLKIELLLNIQ